MPDQDRDYERIFVGDYQRDVKHFYAIGEGQFAFGYFTPDGYFHQGIVRWDATACQFVSD